MPKTAAKTLAHYLFSKEPITDADAFFSGRARAIRLVLAFRHRDPRTNDALAAAVNLGSGNVISMLKSDALGVRPRSTVSDDNVLRLAWALGLDPLMGPMAMMLAEGDGPGISEVSRVLTGELAMATPHFGTFRDLAVAMADGCVSIPPNTAPDIASRIEAARIDAEDASAHWAATYEQLTHLWLGQDATGEDRAVHGEDGDRMLQQADALAGP